MIVAAASVAACTATGAQQSRAIRDAPIQPNLFEIAPEQVAAAAAQGFIEVSGTGSVDVEPDRATVSFAVETRAATAGEAASANGDVMVEALAAVRSGRFSDLQLRTFGYTVQPNYAPGNQAGTRSIVAYTATNNIRASTSDVGDVGRLIDVAIAGGANRISGVMIAATEVEEARERALVLAVEAARREAQTIATALGRELGEPLEVRRASPQIAGPLMAELSYARAATPIEVGEHTVSASVTIKFALGPEIGG